MKQKKQLNSFIQFSGIAAQLGVTIYLGNKLGVWLDDYFNNQEELYEKTVTLIAVFLSLYTVIRQVIKQSNKIK